MTTLAEATAITLFLGAVFACAVYFRTWYGWRRVKGFDSVADARQFVAGVKDLPEYLS